MKRLSPRVNVIPVIGKADSLTPAELAESKKLVMEDIEHYRIPVYNFPYDIEEDDEDTVEENAELRGLMPFAIVGSEETVEIGGRKVRARQYPWGIVEGMCGTRNFTKHPTIIDTMQSKTLDIQIS
jgi:cell division control protein 11